MDDAGFAGHSKKLIQKNRLDTAMLCIAKR